jgi:hypothetical protein
MVKDAVRRRRERQEERIESSGFIRKFLTNSLIQFHKYVTIRLD